jgi:AP-3 complex subunit beta
MDNILPDWLEKGVESTLRDSEYDAAPIPTAISSTGVMKGHATASPGIATPPIALIPTGGSGTPTAGKGPWMDLDSFYADEKEEEEEGSEEEVDGSRSEDESGDSESEDVMEDERSDQSDSEPADVLAHTS